MLDISKLIIGISTLINFCSSYMLRKWIIFREFLYFRSIRRTEINQSWYANYQLWYVQHLLRSFNLSQALKVQHARSYVPSYDLPYFDQ